MIENIGKAGGVVSDANNAYRKEEAFHGKAEQDLLGLQNDYALKIIDLMTDAEITQTELDLYLIARHAKERNAYVASINPDLQDGGSGMKNADAARILLAVRRDNRRAGLARRRLFTMALTPAN